MLRVFGLEAGFSSIRFGRDRLEELGKRVLTVMIMFILCRMRPVMNIAPFAVAFFAGAIAAGGSATALVLGGMLGSIGKAPLEMQLGVPVGTAIVLGGELAWDCLRKRLKLGTSPPEHMRMLRCSLLSGLGALFPGIIFANGDLWESLQTVFCAAAASAAAPFIMFAFETGRVRRFLLQEERIGIALVLCGMAGGLMNIYPPAALGFGSLVILLAYPSGSFMAILLGSSVMLAGAGADVMAVWCLGGICAQTFDDRGRFSRAGAVMLSMFLSALFLQLQIDLITGAVLGAGIYAFVPERWLSAAAVLVRTEQRGCDPDRLAAQLRMQVSRRLLALSTAFGELAESYLTPCNSADEQYLIGKMRDRLCAGCPEYARCWDSGGAVRFLCGLVSDAVEWAGNGGEGVLFAEDMPPEVLRKCRRGRMIPERLDSMLSDFALHRQAEKRRGSENRLISAQFLQAQQLLEELAREQMQPIKMRNRQAARAAAVMEGMGIPLQEVMMLSAPRVEMIAVLKEGRWTREMAKAASQRLTKCFGRTYLPEGDPGREMRFVRSPCLNADTGAGCISREAGAPSGDSHLIKIMDDERLLVLICDGMGSGEAAARESATAVKLLARFLSAGVESGLAIETVNAMMLGRSSEDMFATVDMLVLDLSSGAAEFIKLAACASLIVRGGEIFRVEGGRLPLGILERVQPAVTRTQLQPGDTILMASDGVMDAVEMEVLFDYLRSGPKNMPDMAQRVLGLADNTGRNLRRDDMTAICMHLELNYAPGVAV